MKIELSEFNIIERVFYFLIGLKCDSVVLGNFAYHSPLERSTLLAEGGVVAMQKVCR